MFIDFTAHRQWSGLLTKCGDDRCSGQNLDKQSKTYGWAFVQVRVRAWVALELRPVGLEDDIQLYCCWRGLPTGLKRQISHCFGLFYS